MRTTGRSDCRSWVNTVKLLPAVKLFVIRNKNDKADARAIWTAVQQPGLKLVAVKTEGQTSGIGVAPNA